MVRWWDKADDLSRQHCRPWPLDSQAVSFLAPGRHDSRCERRCRPWRQVCRPHWSRPRSRSRGEARDPVFGDRQFSDFEQPDPAGKEGLEHVDRRINAAAIGHVGGAAEITPMAEAEAERVNDFDTPRFDI
jgi:hypothetical protein